MKSLTKINNKTIQIKNYTKTIKHYNKTLKINNRNIKILNTKLLTFLKIKNFQITLKNTKY